MTRSNFSHQRGLITIFAVLLATPALLSSETPDQLVNKLQKKYEELESFSADFEQVFRGRNVQLWESGIILMKKPGKMYWEYRQPTSKFFITDGKKSYFYVPRDKQVIVSDLEFSSAQTPLLFLVGKGNIQEDFRVELEQQEKALQEDNVLVRLTPKQPQGEFSYMILEVNASSYLIRRLIVVEPIGNRNEYIISNFRENIQIPDKQFDFKSPPDVEVMSR